ncbi:hypothetical protein GCK32_000277 [Trichostrongylus colubriformis]|uniref:RING-type domain-containing protein n=1 Tax=Trichostrongylus colubriformis TaxID=6319 RepID=A0AAN8F7K1_TRICO
MSLKEALRKQEKPVKHLILDTGAIIANVNLHVSLIEVLNGNLVDASKKTGDFVSLSLADIKVLSLTYDIHNEHCRKPDAVPDGETSMADVLHEINANAEGRACDMADPDHPNTRDPSPNTLPEGFCESVGSDDEEGWITEDNLGKALRKMGALEVEEGLTVGCLTTDFALQNVLLSMNLGLVSLNGYRIKKLKSFILRCRACFKTTPIMTKEFCPACGNKMLHKVAVSVDENGEQVLHINWQKLANKRGLKHSLPAPKGGKHADMICGVCGGEFLEQITLPPRIIPHGPFAHYRQPPGRGAHFHPHHHHHPPSQQPHVQQGSSQNAPESIFQSLMGMFNSIPNQPPASSQSRGGSGSNTPSNGRAQGPQAITFSLDQAMQMHPILGQVLSSLGDPHMQVRIHIGDDRDGTMHGPFGDYVWGDNGMDRIVTQLLNQMDGTVRPVGLSEQQINRLPIIKVSEQHVEKDTQCTTCFEDFKLGELVVELLCHHIFHTQCVVPWLQQRPSCPICRQEVVASMFPEPAPGAPTVSSLEAKHDLIEPELD